MGFLQRFFSNVFREGEMPAGPSSFEKLSEAELESHLGVARYGNFTLTDAVRPSYDLQVVPTQGYRHDYYRDQENRNSVPVLMASVSRERLFETFLDLLDPLGFTVDVVLETSHKQRSKGHTDLYREHIDLPVLKSVLWEYEDMLTNDGCTGLAVLNPDVPQEIQFDEHKLLIVYGEQLGEFESILASRGVECDDKIHFLTEAEHVHSSNDRYAREFEQLRTRLGMDEGYSQGQETEDWGVGSRD
ncbi:MAG: hypothetical protein LLG00_03610 [Planctomycetaceae bacterium]|nr:hypothetical protein [Planctomycetaceae bacterium]